MAGVNIITLCLPLLILGRLHLGFTCVSNASDGCEPGKPWIPPKSLILKLGNPARRPTVPAASRKPPNSRHVGKHLGRYRCPEQYGYFRNTDRCDEYVHCQYYVPMTYKCPVGLHFNPQMQRTAVPCDHPSRVQCNAVYKTSFTRTTMPATTPSAIYMPRVRPQQPNYECPQRHGYFKHSNQCGSYVECKNYVPLTYTCPSGLHFNPRVQWTDYPCQEPSKAKCYEELVPTTSTTTTTQRRTTVTPPRPTGKDLSGYTCIQPHGYFSSTQCDEYVECKNDVPRTYSCPSGLHFNHNVQWTDYPCDHPTRAQCNRSPARPRISSSASWYPK